MQEEQRGQVRPLAIGTRLVYYNHERSQEVEATVKEASFLTGLPTQPAMYRSPSAPAHPE
jgi:hypothetical protein